jgi:DNA-binding Lrp family transcriptional regulator
MPLDRLDLRILSELQRDSSQANAALAARVGLSESACLRRVKLLEQSGVIER